MSKSKLSILYPRQEEVTYREIPEESWHDLGLGNQLFRQCIQAEIVPAFLRDFPIGHLILAGKKDAQFGLFHDGFLIFRFVLY